MSQQDSQQNQLAPERSILMVHPPTEESHPSDSDEELVELHKGGGDLSPPTPGSHYLIDMIPDPRSPNTKMAADQLHASLLNAGLKQSYHKNLDWFFSKIYQYYEQKGFWCFTLNRIYHCLTILLTILVSMGIFVFVNWVDLYRCEGIKCREVSIWLVGHPTRTAWSPDGGSQISIFFVIMAFIHSVLALGWAVYCFRSMRQVYNMWSIRSFIVNDLELSDKQLHYMTWNELLEKIVHFQKTVAKISVNDLNQKNIINRIMRKENYLIAFINKEVLNLKPLPFMQDYLSESLLFNIRRITNHLFHGFQIDSTIIDNPNRLYWLFIFYGLFNLIASPFLIFFVVMNGIFRYAAALQHSKAAVLVERRWSHLAEWKFRDFNELPHEFQNRMKKAYEPAVTYLKQFPSYKLNIIAKTLMVMSSTLATTILAMSVLKSDILIHVQIYQFNLLWWLGALLVIWSTSRQFVIEKQATFNPNEEMVKVVKHIQYFPDHWKGKAHSYKVRKEFESFFQGTLWWFINEVVSILVTPWMLLYVLPQNSKEICKFLDKITIDEPGVGHICGLSSFDFDRFQNIRKHRPGPIKSKHVGSLEKKKVHIVKPLLDKMERSFLRFKIHHPNCEVETGDRLIQELAESSSPVHSEKDSPQQTPKTPERPHPAAVEQQPTPTPENLSKTVALFDLLNTHSSLRIDREDMRSFFGE